MFFAGYSCQLGGEPTCQHNQIARFATSHVLADRCRIRTIAILSKVVMAARLRDPARPRCRRWLLHLRRRPRPEAECSFSWNAAAGLGAGRSRKYRGDQAFLEKGSCHGVLSCKQIFCRHRGSLAGLDD